MNNLPKDPPDDNGNSSNGSSTPPTFGTHFNPHTNPVDPNNPYSSQNTVSSAPNPPASPAQRGEPNSPNNPDYPNNDDSDDFKHTTYSEVAQHKTRDAHGRFVHSEHSDNPNPNPNPQTTPIAPTTNSHTISNPSVPSTPPAPAQQVQPPPNPSSILPPIIEVNRNTQPTIKKDPPLFGFFITNPVTYLKSFLNKLLKRQMITLRIPVLALLIIMVGVGGYGLGFKSGINYMLGKLFPNFSPILHRSITAQGIIQKSSDGYFLQANDKNKTLWTLKPSSSNVNLAEFEGMKVQIKGNLTPTPYLIEVSEVISFDTKPTPTPTSLTSPNSPASPAQRGEPNPPNLPNIPNQDLLPKLYPNLTWEVTQRKVLLFTSGKRRIEQEGVYLESAQVNTYPQDFINYYTQELKSKGFKETLNSTDPDGTTITYSKDELFLTFGIKNVYSRGEEGSLHSGSGDNKKLTGYKAYLEHN